MRVNGDIVDEVTTAEFGERILQALRTPITEMEYIGTFENTTLSYETVDLLLVTNQDETGYIIYSIIAIVH